MQADSLPDEPPEKPKNTGVGILSLLQQIFWTQVSNRGLLYYRWILYQLSYQGSPWSGEDLIFFWEEEGFVLIDVRLIYNMLVSGVQHSGLIFLKLNWFIYFNGRTITSQHCAGPCHISTRISHGGTCTPPILNTPSTSLPTPSLWVVPEHLL